MVFDGLRNFDYIYRGKVNLTNLVGANTPLLNIIYDRPKRD